MNTPNKIDDFLFRPEIYKCSESENKLRINSIIEEQKPDIIDDIEQQLEEYFFINNMLLSYEQEKYKEALDLYLKECADNDYGIWVYYPWKNILVRTLEEDEFVAVRTNRNIPKITKEEQDSLRSKKIGVVGLSVGREIATTIAQERLCGEIRLADFDVIELANLNRLKVGIVEIGLPKVISAARQIAEIDPFIKVEIYGDGLSTSNIDDFFTKGGNLDLFYEESDGFDIKVISRYKARELGIPVIMETNDRGMLDVERFDLDNELAIFHGLVSDEELQSMPKLSKPEQLEILKKIVSFESVSDKMKYAFTLLGKSIKSWPQLSSDISFGAGMAAGTGRLILLGEEVNSGRYYNEYVNKLKS